MPAPGPAVIREQLSQAFEPRQAQVLSDVLADAIALRERYVEEMSQVRQELVHLAQAQQRTELSLVVHSESLWRKAHAIAKANPALDVGDLYHVLRCLELSPPERLRRGLGRVRLRPHTR